MHLPCLPLLRVTVLCVLGLCAFVLGVWCACIAFVYIVRPSPVNVVNITAVRGVIVRFGARGRQSAVPHDQRAWGDGRQVRRV